MDTMIAHIVIGIVIWVAVSFAVGSLIGTAMRICEERDNRG